jgi:hypothetical protein
MQPPDCHTQSSGAAVCVSARHTLQILLVVMAAAVQLSNNKYTAPRSMLYNCIAYTAATSVVSVQHTSNRCHTLISVLLH